MNNGDIVLLIVLVGAFIVGFVWGTARSLLFLGGGALVFLIAAHARVPLSSYLARQWTNLSPIYADMVGLLVVYGLGLMVLTGIVWFGARNTGLSARYPDIDRLVGGLVAVACAVMVVAGLDVTLSLFYGHDATVARTVGGDWSASLYRGLVDSQIGGAIHRSLLPNVGSIANPLLPIDIREALGAG
ncbi:MAG: CvpA family protein [Chloroflexota bacterium]